MAISRGFRGRRHGDVDPARVPPGQYVTRDFPVLSAGPTPHTPLTEWSFTIGGLIDQPRSWTWEEFLALPSETPVHDVPSFDHLVTQWMSTVNVSAGSARSSSHVHERGSSTAPRMVNVHRSSEVWGVGPADRTGKSCVTYWPGGTRDGSTSVWRVG